jgi:hypothetical protein
LRAGDLHRRFVVPEEEARRMKRALTIRNVAKGAGAVVIGLIALDLVATLVTVAIGAEFLKR